MSGERFYPEIMAPGVGVFDYDNDGDLDVYLVQSQMLGKNKTLKDATFPPKAPLEDRLYRNDLAVAADGTRTLRFTDVTGASGIASRPTGWASRPATTTTTASWTCIAPGSAARCSCTTTATAPSPT